MSEEEIQGVIERLHKQLEECVRKAAEGAPCAEVHEFFDLQGKNIVGGLTVFFIPFEISPIITAVIDKLAGKHDDSNIEVIRTITDSRPEGPTDAPTSA